MNALVKMPSKSMAKPLALGSNGRSGKKVDYLEFLPAHLEILETPASPRASWMLWTLCCLLAAALAWSWFGHLDIHAIAQGRIQPNGRSKVVQPTDPGRVRALSVSNGMLVRAGDLLIELDPTEAEADRTAASVSIEALDGEIVRRLVALEAARIQAEAPVPISFPQTVGAVIRLREQEQLSAEYGQYLAQRATLKAQVAQSQAQRERLVSSISARERLTGLLNERVQMRETLLERQTGSRASVIDALQLLAEQNANLAYDKGQLLENAASIDALARRLEQATSEFLATQSQKLADAQRRRDELAQSLIKAQSRFEKTRLVAPIDGIVQQLSVTTVGQVVSTGQALMVIVPTGSTLEVEALIQNKDIAFLEVGQSAVIKVDSLPFTRYGLVPGVVRRISPDAVDEREAGVSDAAASAKASAGNVGGIARVQNLVFPVTVELGRKSLTVDGQEISLSPGMTVTVEVRTGTRRVIDYLLSPIREVASQAGGER